MTKPAEIELEQLKAAVDYLASVLEEGSLVAHYDSPMREEVADILRLLLKKVVGLPAGVPEHLVQAATIRAIIGAADCAQQELYREDSDKLRHNMRQAEVVASLQGHTLGPWQPSLDPDAEQEFFAVCLECGGSVNVSPHSTYDLLTDHNDKMNGGEPLDEVLSQETIVALWDLAQLQSD